MERHITQQNALARLAKLRAAIEALPPDEAVGVYLLPSVAIWLEGARFNEMFRGKTAKKKDGIAWIFQDGVKYQTDAGQSVKEIEFTVQG